MLNEFITISLGETQKLGKALAREIMANKRFDLFRPKRPKEVEPRGAFIICLSGDLGSGKTTFTQGLLRGLKIKGPHTSPTFIIMKKYGNNIYHLDAYRVKDKDILNLGWEETITDPKNIVIVEWADRVRKIIPKKCLWVKFKWIDNNTRKIILKA